MTRIYARNLADARHISGGRRVELDRDSYSRDGLLPFLTTDGDIALDLDELDALTRVAVAVVSAGAAIVGGLIWLAWKAAR